MGFKNEALLREAVITLLRVMPGVTGVIEKHGRGEVGKDIVFNIPGGLGETLLCACVVKSERISGSADSTTGARTVFHQAEQALDTQFTDATGVERRVALVYVVTPYDLSSETIESIKGRLKDASNRVTFIGGSALLDLFKKYQPDYLEQEFASLELRLAKSVRHLDDQENLVAAAQQYRLQVSANRLSSVYVRPSFACNVVDYKVAFPSSLGPTILGGQRTPLSAVIGFQSQLAGLISAFRLFASGGLSRRESLIRIERVVGRLSEQVLAEWCRLAGLGVPDVRLRLLKGEPVDGRFELPAQGDLADCIREAEELIAAEAEHVNTQFARSTKLARLGATAECVSSDDYRLVSNLTTTAEALGPSVVSEVRRSTLLFPASVIDEVRTHLLIVGAAGMGKTSFCKWNVMRATERLVSGATRTLPVYVPLNLLANIEDKGFEDTFLQYAGRSAFFPEGIGDEGSQLGYDRLTLYLDGLDEVSSPERQKAIVELVRSGVSGRDDVQVVMTARDYLKADWLSWMSRLELACFSDVQLSEFVDRWLESDQDKVPVVRKQLANVPGLRAVMGTPLLAALTLVVFKGTGQIPPNRTTLYDAFTDLLVGGWDMAKSVERDSRYDRDTKKAVLLLLAGRVHQVRVKRFGLEAIEKVARGMNDIPRFDGSLLAEELVRDGLLRTIGNEYEYSHLSFQEYFAARDFIGEPGAKRATEALRDYLRGDDWWKDVITFYLALGRNPNHAYAWLKRTAASTASRDFSMARYVSVWRDVAMIFPETRMPDPVASVPALMARRSV